MDKAVKIFTAALGDPGSDQMLLLLLLGGAIFLAFLALLFAAVPKPDPVKKRLATLGLIDKPETVISSIRREENTLIDRISYLFLPRGDKARQFTTHRLKLAGYRSLSAFTKYYTLRTTLMVLLPLTIAVLSAVLPELPVQKAFQYGLMAFLVGMIGPSYFLDKKIAQRQRLLRNALPDALDMLVVCTEAGLGLNAALLRVAQEIEHAHPEFSAELMTVNAEIRAGIDRDIALRNLVERTGLEDLKGLIVLLIQSLRFGTSVALTLRIYSEEFRDRRLQLAEEAAAKLGTKMIFPMIFCFLPCFFVVAIGPAVLNFIKVFSK